MQVGVVDEDVVADHIEQMAQLAECITVFIFVPFQMNWKRGVCAHFPSQIVDKHPL